MCSWYLSGVGAGCLTAGLGNEGCLERVEAFFALHREHLPRNGSDRNPFRSHAEEALVCWLVMNCPGLWIEIRGWLQFKLSPPQPPFVLPRKIKPPKEVFADGSEVALVLAEFGLDSYSKPNLYEKEYSKLQSATYKRHFY